MAEPPRPPSPLPEGWTGIDPADPVPSPESDLACAYARCFGGSEGARVLGDLRGRTLDRALGPAASDAELRHLEGQRALVVRILALTARGRDAC